MHELAKKLIGKRIDILLDEWDFEERKNKHPEECVCYRGKPCHDIKELNCFFCYCPNYDLSVKEERCNINSPKGKYFNAPSGKILDCSDCDFPHKKENAKKILMKQYID